MGAFDDTAPIIIPDPEDPEAAAAFRRKWRWDAHEQVILRGDFTAADSEDMTNAATTTDKKGVISFLAGTARIKLMERMIKGWTLTRNGQPIPVSPHSIRQLPDRYQTPILQQCDALARAMSEEEQEDFLDAANAPTEATFTSTKAHPLKS